MLLSDLLAPSVKVEGELAAVEIRHLSCDSRKIAPGSLYFAIPGVGDDGARYAPDAIAKGAVAVVANLNAQVPDNLTAPLIRVENVRRALALAAARFAQLQPPIVMAVTGTSGKSSVADFTRQIFAHLGHKAASLGTIGIITPDRTTYGSLTTPDPITLHATLAELAHEGITHLIMEASSHGLDQHRLDGVKLTAGAFTNLGRDHLDYHPTVEHYLGAKLRLFRELLVPGQGQAVVNTDGPYAGEVIAGAKKRGLDVVTVGSKGQHLRLLGATREGFGQRLVIEAQGKTYDILLPLIGAYQVENALTAAGLAHVMEGADPVLKALEHLKGVPGRLEVVGEAAGGLAIVDYAHKPEALQAALASVRPFATGKLVVVFGCGGDRDKGKRPIMGQIAVETADVTIVTDDNPRTEDAATIRAQVLAGAKGAHEIGDRAAAIRSAVEMMSEGDVVLIAGKGHETGQIVGDKVLPFSDKDVVAQALAAREEPLWTMAEVIAATGASLHLPSPGTGEGGAKRRMRDSTDARTAASTLSPSPALRASSPVPGEETIAITGVSIDTRTLRPGDLFVALADARDGHEFVEAAFAMGAAAALVRADWQPSVPPTGPLLCVDDPLKALERLGVAARARLKATARVIAVTGSAGKTTTKEMLRACLARVGQVHASEKSYNNHWGVPLTLARMPADTDFAVLEIGMNHAGEITPLSKMVRPHVAIVTTVAAVHLEHFPSLEAIADAKAEIFSGLERRGTAIIPGDNSHTQRLAAAARAKSATVQTFGGVKVPGSTRSHDLDLNLTSAEFTNGPLGNQTAWAHSKSGDNIRFELALRGVHMAINALAVLLALGAVGADVDNGRVGLATMGAVAGRGKRALLLKGTGQVLLIDESYNANPASMQAALSAMTTVGGTGEPWRMIAVLGDMLELGGDSPQLHLGLKPAIEAARVTLVFACGPMMKHLYDALPPQSRGDWAPTSTDLAPLVLAALKPGDVVMVKGSNGSRMSLIVDAIKKHLA